MVLTATARVCQTLICVCGRVNTHTHTQIDLQASPIPVENVAIDCQHQQCEHQELFGFKDLVGVEFLFTGWHFGSTKPAARLQS